MRRGRILVLSGNGIVRTCLRLMLEASTAHQVTACAWNDGPRIPVIGIYDLVILNVPAPELLPGLLSQLTQRPVAAGAICIVPASADGQSVARINDLVTCVSSTIDALQLLQLIGWMLDHALSAGIPLRTPPKPAVDLTWREKAVVGLIAKGLSNHQIARQLVIAPPTVRVHRHHLMRKLGIRSSVQLYEFSCSVEHTLSDQ